MATMAATCDAHASHQISWNDDAEESVGAYALITHCQSPHTLLVICECVECVTITNVPQPYLLVVAATDNLRISSMGQQAGDR